MQSTTEQGRRDTSRIPLDVHFENLLAFFDSVVASAVTASARNPGSFGQVTAHLLDESLFELRIWSENIKAVMPDAGSSLNSLRILGKFDGPVVAILLNVLGEIEKALRELSADTKDNNLYVQVNTRDTSSSGRIDTLWTGYSVSNLTQHVLESKPQSIV